jgi:hypothetical protein
MAKNFFFMTLGILALALAYNLGAERARADWNPSAPGVIIGGSNYRWWDTSGECWKLGLDGWTREPVTFDLPVPVSQIKFIDFTGLAQLITTDDHGWVNNNGWRDMGPFPGSVSLQTESWAKIKGRYAAER